MIKNINFLVRVWESIQEQAQAKGDVTSPKGTVSLFIHFIHHKQSYWISYFIT
jgi:hypothetical protein